MSQSLSAVYIHLIFSTKDRVPFLRDSQVGRAMPAATGFSFIARRNSAFLGRRAVPAVTTYRPPQFGFFGRRAEPALPIPHFSPLLTRLAELA